MKNKLILIAIMFALAGSFVLSACGQSFNSEVASTSYSYLTMDMNPSVDFLLDEDDNVIDFVPINEDGAILLDELRDSVIGFNIEDALDSILEEAVKLGYLDLNSSEQEPAAVILSALSDKSPNAPTELLGRVSNRVDKYFHDNGLFGRGVVAEEIFEMTNEASSRNRAAELISQISNRHGDREELKSRDVNELLNTIKDEIASGERPFSGSNIATQRSQRASMFDGDFDDWVSQRGQVAESVRNQIKAFQENDEDLAAKDWVVSLRDTIRNRFEVEEYTEDTEDSEDAEDPEDAEDSE